MKLVGPSRTVGKRKADAQPQPDLAAICEQLSAMQRDLAALKRDVAYLREREEHVMQLPSRICIHRRNLLST